MPKSPPDPPQAEHAAEPAPGLLRRWGLSWSGWRDNRRGEWWLLAQLVLIAAHLLPPWPSPGAWGYAWPLPVAIAGAVLFLLGLVLAAQAFWGLGPSLTPLPEPMPGAALVTSGSYARCRHPLYQAVLLCSLGVTLVFGSLLHLALLFGLAAVLGGKARREERALQRLHPAYVAYRQSTAAIIPHLPWLDWREL
ncbi:MULTISPECIES: methyltransferase family protein [Aphanothece]|uniref:methyltransferase family protein n=1 Tax=Aphanothece TaxID=1121 RepID=UPI00398E9FE2